MKYYRLDKILKQSATYNVIIGGRSNGKTYAVQEYIIKNFWKGKGQGVLLRRYRDDFTGARGQQTFSAQRNNIFSITGGVYDDITYYRHAWYLCKHEDDGTITRMNDPFCYGISLASMEHDKSTSYPEVTTILFDEFLTNYGYLRDEFVTFMHVLSTVIRDRTNIKIFMVGNLISHYSPYFEEMGLDKINSMHAGDIHTYSYGESNLKVAVEMVGTGIRKKSSHYFAFNNPRLAMITGDEFDMLAYKHTPKYKPKNIKKSFFIELKDSILECDIIMLDKPILCVHVKTTPIKSDKDIIISKQKICTSKYVSMDLKSSIIYPFIKEIINKDDIYFASNAVGEMWTNFLNTK